MSTDKLLIAKKELMNLQKQLAAQMNKGKHKDLVQIRSIKNDIKEKKMEIGTITRSLISQL